MTPPVTPTPPTWARRTVLFLKRSSTITISCTYPSITRSYFLFKHGLDLGFRSGRDEADADVRTGLCKGRGRPSLQWRRSTLDGGSTMWRGQAAQRWREEHLQTIMRVPSPVHMAKLCLSARPSDIVRSEQTRLEFSDSGVCFFKSVCYDPSGPFKKSQVFPAPRHASWRSASCSDGKMDLSSDWGISGHSPFLDATKGEWLILRRGIP